MTEQELIKKAIKHFENVRDENFVILQSFGKNEGENDLIYRNRKMYAEAAIKALKAQIAKENRNRTIQGGMTNSEAIELLDNLIGMIEDTQGNDYDTAFLTAIKALKALDNETKSQTEEQILRWCIILMQELVIDFQEWYEYVHGENAISQLDDEERFCIRKSYFRIVQELFLMSTNHSGGTSTRMKCNELGVDSSEEIELCFEKFEKGVEE